MKSTSVTYCADCFPALKAMPDQSVELICTDPPFGLSITDRHPVTEKHSPLVGGAARPFGGSRSVNVEREREEMRAIHGGYGRDRPVPFAVSPGSGGQKLATLKAPSKSSKSHLNFILRSTTAPRRTRKYSGSC